MAIVRCLLQGDLSESDFVAVTRQLMMDDDDDDDDDIDQEAL